MANHHLNKVKYRLKFIEGVIVLSCIFFLYSLLNVQVISLEEEDSSIVSFIRAVPQRGKIFDRNGSLLAASIPSYSILVQPALLELTPDSFSLLLKVGEIKENSLKEKLKDSKPFYLKRRLSEIPDELRKIPGIVILSEPKRRYPYEKTASHVLGFVDGDGYGKQGIEGYFDNIIRGKEGITFMAIDAAGRGIPSPPQGTSYPADGSDLYLTIDIQAQKIIESSLERGISKYKAKGGVAILLEVNTGEIWAMACYPSFNPNSFFDSTPAERWNQAIGYNFEPGSVLKTITLAIALEEELVTLDTKFPAPSTLKVKGGTIRNYQNKAYDVQTVQEALRTSTNTVFAQLAFKIGGDLFTEYYNEKLGVGRFVEVTLSGRELGIFTKPYREMHLANIGFGQGIALTPLQLISFYSSLANGGFLYSPTLVKTIGESEENNEIKFQPKIIRTIFSSNTCKQVLNALRGTISKKTNISAYIEGYSLGGKTGTAQKIISGSYSQDKTINTFMGFITLDNPRFAILVTLDEAEGTASATSVPVFGEIAKNLIEYLRIPRE